MQARGLRGVGPQPHAGRSQGLGDVRRDLRRISADRTAPHHQIRQGDRLLDRQGRLVGAIGSPGGSSILAYVAKELVGTLEWNLSMQDAIALPNLVVRGEMVGADTQMMTPQIRDALGAAGMPLRPNATETSGLHGVIWRDGRWDAGADPRREGVAISEVR